MMKQIPQGVLVMGRLWHWCWDTWETTRGTSLSGLLTLCLLSLPILPSVHPTTTPHCLVSIHLPMYMCE